MLQVAASHALESSYYTPDRIDHWLFCWAELVELALPTVGSTSHIDPTPGAPFGSLRSIDPMKLCDVMSDIQSGLAALDPTSKGFKLIYLVMQLGPDPQAAALLDNDSYTKAHMRWWNRVIGAGSLLYLPPHATAQVYHFAVREMAAHLGWGPRDQLQCS